MRKNLFLLILGYSLLIACAKGVTPIELISELEIKTPELLQYSNDLRLYKKKKMYSNHKPIIWLANIFTQTQKKGKTVSIKIIVIEPNQNPMRHGGIEYKPKQVIISLPIRKYVDGSRRANLLWSRLVWEVSRLNEKIAMHEHVTALRKGEIGKQDFVLRVSKTNYLRACEVRRFFDEIWKPWSLKHGSSPTLLREWYGTAQLESFEEWHKEQKELGGVKSLEKWAQKLSVDKRKGVKQNQQ